MYWQKYVPVATRRAQARKQMDKLRKKGKDIQPVEIEGRAIARSFWGKGWCQHLESFSDFSNRLPRGRTYVRNGSVCHLEVQPGLIEAYVSGSSLYKVTIQIKKQKAASWKSIKDKCAGQIGSMLELLQGKLSKQVMAIVADREEGLFPKPREITLGCSCPDGARMCKHVAAVLYGVGNRLDDSPQLLFLLRGVDAEELIASEMALPDTAAAVGGDALMDDQLSDIFGVDVDTETPAPDGAHGPIETDNDTVAPRKKRRAKKKPASRKSSMKAAESSVAKEKPKAPPKIRPTGKSVLRLRKKLKMNTREFADALGVSTATVRRWEETSGRLNLHARTLHALAHLHQEK